MSPIEEIALRQGTLWGLLTIGTIAALIYAVFFCHRQASRSKTFTKAIPMPAYAGAVWVSFGFPLVWVALLLSAVGDIALSRKGDRAFLIGLGGFALAHLAYVLHFWTLGTGPTIAHWPWIALLVVLALSTEVWLAPFTGALKGPVRVYVVLITLMGLTALGLGDRPLALWGAVAFILSDTILALQLFRMRESSPWQRAASVALWLLYAGGQLAILLGAGFTSPLFHL